MLDFWIRFSLFSFLDCDLFLNHFSYLRATSALLFLTFLNDCDVFLISRRFDPFVLYSQCLVSAPPSGKDRLLFAALATAGASLHTLSALFTTYNELEFQLVARQSIRKWTFHA